MIQTDQTFIPDLSYLNDFGLKGSLCNNLRLLNYEKIIAFGSTNNSLKVSYDRLIPL